MRTIAILSLLILTCFACSAQHGSGSLTTNNLANSKREIRKERRIHRKAFRISYDPKYATRKFCYSARAGHKPKHKRINEAVAVNKRR